MDQKPCWKCKRPIDDSDRYCRWCGMGQGSRMPWYYQHWGIILVMLMVGPFALINVFLSPLIVKKSKIVYTIIILLFTALLVWQFYKFAVTMNNTYNDLLQGNMDALGNLGM